MADPLPLQYGQYYHIYNRGNNRENLFIEERNYRYFLRLYALHIGPVAETFAYCLLPNHFHFLVRIKDPGEVRKAGGPGDGMVAAAEASADPQDLKKPSQYFSNLFNAYAKAFNRAYDRSGALFSRPFGRIPVTSDAYFVRLVVYIHQNPEKHGILPDFRDWPYSSYHAHLSQKPTRVKRDEVLAWFEGQKGYSASHRILLTEAQVTSLAPEDLD